MTTDDNKGTAGSLPPEEMLKLMMGDMRAFIGVVGAWADVLSGEIYQELRPQAIEALQNCASNMALTYEEVKSYLEAIKERESGNHLS